jgi:hypothetical protein
LRIVAREVLEVLSHAARLAVFKLPGGQGYVVDVQSDHPSGKVQTRIVASSPFDDLGKPIAVLNPVVSSDGRDSAFVAQSLASSQFPRWSAHRPTDG